MPMARMLLTDADFPVFLYADIQHNKKRKTLTCEESVLHR